MRIVVCTETYVEDNIEYYTEGNEYGAVKHGDGCWSIRNNFGGYGAFGRYFSAEFEDYFKEVHS